MSSTKFPNQTAQSSSTAQNASQQASGNQQPSTSSVLHQSKDCQTMISVLKDMGVEDYEPRVINQLLEFSYRACLSFIFKLINTFLNFSILFRLHNEFA